MKRFFALLLCLLVLAPAALADSNSYYLPIPNVLQFSQKEGNKQDVRHNLTARTTIPHTQNSAVDKEMAALINAMKDDALAAADSVASRKVAADIDVGANISRSGESIMSFLTIARISSDRKQLWVEGDARTYDMATGERLTLASLFDADSEGWDVLADAVRTQLTAVFSKRTPDAQALDALCTREALAEAQFTMTPVRLLLHYPASVLYPGAVTMMHVELYYRDIAAYMNEYGRRQSDNSRYRMVALTYDDGPSKLASARVMDKLRLYGANATFFLVGENISKNSDTVCRENDAGHEVASHSYRHEYLKSNNTAQAAKWVAQVAEELDGLIGVTPSCMRAPGGIFEPYINAASGLPQIHWSLISGDADTPEKTTSAIADKVRYQAIPGSIVLMHDLNPRAQYYTESILQGMEARNTYCVTVPELCAQYGVDFTPDVILHGCVQEAEAIANK